MKSKIMQGNCLKTLKTLPDNSVDSIVTDPPYELGFMGKSWDATGIAFNVDVWQECLRVLKPGGHLLAFSGSRTYHRMACAIEDAGFQIRDQIMWVYGSGFPKSLNISKAMDKMDAKDEQQARRYRFTAWVRSTGVTSKEIDEATKTYMGSHYTTHATQPSVMTREHLEACRHLLGDIPRWVETECNTRSVESKNFASREVVGSDTKARSTAGKSALPTVGGTTIYETWDITAPATDAAKQWDGWGTALKPAHEPIVMARKPLDGTVANNVLTYGVGGINIDVCRVAHASEADRASATPQGRVTVNNVGNMPDVENGGRKELARPDTSLGRFPANFIHDGSDEVLELFPKTKSVQRTGKRTGRSADGVGYYAMAEQNNVLMGHSDSGSAARFFYCSKASKKERNAGLDKFTTKTVHRYSAGIGEGLTPNAPAYEKNNHPTVKPLDLMRYLCKLVTPPNGIILDPFTGSGSTLVAAKQCGYKYIGCELDKNYIKIARARLKNARKLTRKI